MIIGQFYRLMHIPHLFSDSHATLDYNGLMTRLMALYALIIYGIFPTEVHALDKQKAYFAGGCFWCTEAAFDYVEGVLETTSGYIGGEKENPTYQEIGTGQTGHFEALEVVYDADKVGYEVLLQTYWQNIDPLDEGGQFADRGSQYYTAIFYQNDVEKEVAEKSKEEVAALFNKPVVTKILPYKPFYPAEAYHQDYHKKNPERYNAYKNGSGRPIRLKQLWGSE